VVTKHLVALAALAVAAMPLLAQERPAQPADWIRKGDVATLAAALDKDPPLANRPDPQGVPPLFWAGFYGQKAAIDLLVARGADLQSTCQFGTALHGAVSGARPEVVRLLVAAGLDPNAGGPAGGPPLVLAAQRGSPALVEALLDAGAAIGATDRMGNSALLMAASYGHEPVVRLLVARKSSVTGANARGDTPLDVARREGHAGLAAFLEAQGGVGRQPVAARSGAYLGQPPPGMTAKLFAPSIVSTERRELNLAWLPDGRAVFFSRDRGARGTVVMMTASDGGRWTRTEPAPFSRGGHSDVDMFVTADGNQIYFCSDRPLPGTTPPVQGAVAPSAGGTPPPPPPAPRSAIWTVARTATGWGEPAWLGPVITSGMEDYYPTLTRQGTLYFSSNRPGGFGENDIYRARRVNGQWTAPENLGRPVSSEFREFDPFIAPDESYVIFASTRPGGLGGADLYVSFREASGAWGEPKNMGPGVNSPASDYTPMLSPDGKYLFFTSGRAGQDDIFWVDAGVIAALRPQTSNSGGQGKGSGRSGTTGSTGEPERRDNRGETTMKTIRMEEMTWPAIRDAIGAGCATVVVAVGATEQHGPHLPTMTDARIGDALAELVARKLGGALVARTIDVGISEHHLAFGGTLSLRPETLAAVLRDYVASLVRSGFRRIVFVPTHGGNFPAVQEAIDAARLAHPGIHVDGYTDLLGFAGFLNRVSEEHGVTAQASGAHAGESETSMMLALEPDLVVRERWEPGYLGPLGAAEVKRILERGMPDLTANGVLGDPRSARAEKGVTYLERLAEFLVEHLKRVAAARS
jgi:creatinine amidohydrolase